MSAGQTLRALVNERLTAAAEDIFVLFERTIAEYEEQLCRSKKENERKQKVWVHREGDQVHAVTLESGPTFEQDSRESVEVKDDPEEECFKQKEEQLPEFTAVCVKSEEQSSQTEHREETRPDSGEEPVFRHGVGKDDQKDDPSDPDIYEEPPAQQMETEANGDDQNHVSHLDLRLREHGNMNIIISEQSASDDRPQSCECPFCAKLFSDNRTLGRHLSVHTGEKPFSGPGFKTTALLRKHLSPQATKKGFGSKSFTHKGNPQTHKESRVGERPFGCTECNARFVRRANLNRHLRVHVQGEPFTV